MNIRELYRFSVLLLVVWWLAACTPQSASVSVKDWGMVEGQKVYLFTLTNASGETVKITNYGGIITSWLTPDRQGKFSSVVVGFDSLSPYLAGTPYFGAIIGRYGNRIADGRFSIGDSSYRLALNNGKNHLHGGIQGFDKRVWEATVITGIHPALKLHYRSTDGEEGYPGTLDVSVTYTLTAHDGLEIAYEATTTRPTPVNLTNHSYFNLSGNVSTSILAHTLQIKAHRYTPVDSTLIPTGEMARVEQTPFDFLKPQSIGRRIHQVPGGYDHNFILDGTGTMQDAVATLVDSASGRKLEVFTTEPGLQFYSGNFLDGSIRANNGQLLQKHAALCLETQHFPNSPNEPAFPSTILFPGKKYQSLTRYKLSQMQ